MVKDQEIDPDLYDLFISESVYDNFMKDYTARKTSLSGQDKKEADAAVIMAPYRDL
jgi:hypothetical protein